MNKHMLLKLNCVLWFRQKGYFQSLVECYLGGKFFFYEDAAIIVCLTLLFFWAFGKHLIFLLLFTIIII